jgi:hypothetical protein
VRKAIGNPAQALGIFHGDELVSGGSTSEFSREGIDVKAGFYGLNWRRRTERGPLKPDFWLEWGQLWIWTESPVTTSRRDPDSISTVHHSLFHVGLEGVEGNCWQEPAGYLTSSFTASTRSPATSFIVCTVPEGQRISTNSADVFAPSPKCTGPALDDAYPQL